jgi:hypothetical protein
MQGIPGVNSESVAAVALSIKRYGFRQPIIVDGEGVVVAGHTRLEAARVLGLEKVPVVVAAKLSPQQIKAYRIADNSAGTKSHFDYDLLRVELDSLPDFNPSDFNLDPFLTPPDAGSLDGLFDLPPESEGGGGSAMKKIIFKYHPEVMIAVCEKLDESGDNYETVVKRLLGLEVE